GKYKEEGYSKVDSADNLSILKMKGLVVNDSFSCFLDEVVFIDELTIGVVKGLLG
ncbi:3922_t:CDS:2, partial [Diversispora eburnea]